MGFYQITLKKDLDIHPRFFGKTLKSYLQDKLLQEVEGTCNGKYGYIVAVTKITYFGPGIVRKDGTGFCTFSLEYEAIVCRPYKGEVTDTVVTSVNKVGFFAEAGPLQIFVSSHLIPEDWEFNAVGDPCYQSPDASLTIQEGSQVRLRIVGIKMDQNEIYCIGSIKEDYLGFIAGSV